MKATLLALVPLAASYSLCDKTNYPYSGQTVTVTLNPSPGTITFRNQSIDPAVSGSITIVDGCSFQLSKDFTMNSLLTCTWVGGKINGPKDGSDGLTLSNTQVTSASGGAVFQFITSVGNYASYKDFNQFRLYHVASQNVIATADINVGSNGRVFGSAPSNSTNATTTTTTTTTAARTATIAPAATTTTNSAIFTAPSYFIFLLSIVLN
ncbi:hypothetical protein HK103_007009 [Boothiomyces macroporosus]|uniref:Uncharacterized protein n=1 Tax=Boothiomyces macroporosus TaxID=261099 RepID=A0AAD5UH31_9FUNG|nr:hypothetical protein HK103_007009 [Boothiomyces macroporosus]